MSWKDDPAAREEMPASKDFRIVQEVNYHLIALYRIEAVSSPKR